MAVNVKTPQSWLATLNSDADVAIHGELLHDCAAGRNYIEIGADELPPILESAAKERWEVFVGFDLEGDGCLYFRRVDAEGDHIGYAQPRQCDDVANEIQHLINQDLLKSLA